MTLLGLIGAGARALREHPRLCAALYAVQLTAGLLVTVAVAGALGDVFGQRPLFDRAVAGDTTLLASLLQSRLALVIALVWGGAAVALGYWLLSFYLAAGLWGALAGRPFGVAAGARFWAYLRLWLWSLLPYLAAAVVFALGLAFAGPRLEDTVRLPRFSLKLALGGLPGALVFALTACAVDYARAILVDERAAGRALLSAFRLLVSRAAPLPHYFTYVVLWLGLSAGYLALTLGRPFAGAAGALALFGLRQLLLAGRWLARFWLVAGQVAFTRGRSARSA